MNNVETLKKILRFAIPCLLILAALAVSYFRVLDGFELGTLDIRFRLRPAGPVTDKVVIVEIGEDTIKDLGRFPFDRSYHATLIEALSSFGAKVIAFDIFFSEPHSTDGDFEDAMKTAGNVYLPTVFELEAKPGAIPRASGYAGKCLDSFLSYAKGSGHINAVPDIDGKYRRVPPYIMYKNTFYPQLAVLIACDYLGIEKKDVILSPGKYLKCGHDIKIPLDENSLMIVNYTGKWGAVYKHYSYIDILRSYFALISEKPPIIDPAVFKDKICFVGLTATGTVDVHPNPFEAMYPTVGVYPETFNSLINKKFISRASRGANLVILLLMGLFVAVPTLRLKPLKSISVLIAAVIVYMLGLIAIFCVFGLWVDMIYPVVAMFGLYLGLTLYKYVVEWKRRLVMENELGTAKKIQESFLPKAVPEVQGLDIKAAMFTARQVGGDLYDFIDIGKGRLGIMVGDVSGKGVPASLFMAMTMSEFRYFNAANIGPQETLSRLNAKLVKESSSNLFVTMFYAAFDMKNRSVDFANGGHLPLLHVTRDAKVELLDSKEGMPLGLAEGDYSQNKINFSAGDIFVFYTDGITEAMNSRKEMYGIERLTALAGKLSALPAEKILESIEKDVRRFEPKSTQHDDMTLIVVKIT